MNKTSILIFILMFSVLLTTPVFATHTIKVDEKRIDGIHGSAMFIIGQDNSQSYAPWWEEYPVGMDDYDKVNFGDTVTLEKDGLIFRIVKVEK